MTIDEFIHFMARHAPAEVESYLSANEVNLNQGNTNGGFCPLTAAVELGSNELVEVLLDHGADPNYYADHDGPALGRAIECAVDDWDVASPRAGVPSLGTVRLLVDRGADPRRPWKDGSTAYDLAQDYGFEAALSYFRRREWEQAVAAGMPLDIEGLIYVNRTQEAVDIITSTGPDLNQPGAAGPTPLETAIEKGDTNLVEFLVANGADPNHVDDAGVSPLAAAIRFAVEQWDYRDHRAGQPSMVMIETLIRLGADPAKPPGRTYQRVAARWHHQPAREFFAQFEVEG